LPKLILFARESAKPVRKPFIPMKKLSSVCLMTQDVRELCDFYSRVLELSPEGDDAFAEFSSTGIHLSISSIQVMEDMAPGLKFDPCAGNCFLEFKVEDVDREYERLKALQVMVIKPPTTQPWGLRSVWFCDPQGNRVNFYAHVNPAPVQDEET
jgi:predicted enzyme related to lactoylglutathione lyase